MPSLKDNLKVEDLPRVCVQSDARTMSEKEMVQALDKSEAMYSQYNWESCYLVAALYAMGKWTIGLNETPKNIHFMLYMRELFPKRDYTVSELMMRIDCYVTYSQFSDPDIVDKVKSFNGLSKPHIATLWVDLHRKDIKKVKRILDVCLITPAGLLRQTLEDQFPTKTSKQSSERDLPDRPKIAPDTLVRYFTTRRDIGPIDNRLFIPRQSKMDMELEFATSSVVQAYISTIDTEATLDDVYFQMVHAWLGTLEPAVRTKLLRAAHQRWVITCVEQQGGDDTKWPFEEVALLQAAE